MNRSASREQAFIFLFESTFGFQTAEEIIENSKIARKEKVSEFSRKLFENTLKNKDKIDICIENNSKDWKVDRLSRTTISILRLAIYEILISEEKTPVSVAINEAVELAKKYSTPEEAAYVNGVLGSAVKND
ncbi:MAG: transcription antitermination factor NusB [Acutalibacteraceae bacterium]